MPSKSTTLGIAVIFAGYAISSYGLVLVRGWDIPWRQWINPLDPWQWPKKIPQIPATQIWPSKAAGSAGAGPVGGPGNALGAAGAAALNAFGGRGTTQAGGTTTAGGRG